MTDSPEEKGKKFDGVRAAAEMLNHMEGPDRDRLLAGIARENPELARRIQDRMFVFEDLVRLDMRGIQVLFRELPRALLLTALRKTENGVQEHLLGALSMRMREQFLEELAEQGLKKVSEVEQAQRKIVEEVKKLEAEGRITLEVHTGGSSES